MVSIYCDLAVTTSFEHIFIFFFFQAEDGIRDHCVTGVQTCALPISNGVDGLRQAVRQMVKEGADWIKLMATAWRRPSTPLASPPNGQQCPPIMVIRSEERRVGKECRSRWSPYH